MRDTKHWTALLLLAAGILVPSLSSAATAIMNATGTIAPHIVLSVLTNLDFGELLMTTPGAPGFFDLDPATNAATPSNATQIGAPAVGSFTIQGRAGTNVVLTITQAGFICDTAYINPCSGIPALVLRNTFTSGTVGQISTASCTGVKCIDTVYVGGRFDFDGDEEGRWTNVLTITANYQ